ncbi:S8 family serine peptidase [Calothrix sp. 336/3]|uniref:S8 family serine peptidase n=1 Tax=Calothrix sp. 336/3 TaxID=1337936 RepID=UPI000624D0E6|nr:S8 family serine peptidase [Calothrix sp. 336/3]AKG22385.1 Subtilisin [Calothrix sp. 336/3]
MGFDVASKNDFDSQGLNVNSLSLGNNSEFGNDLNIRWSRSSYTNDISENNYTNPVSAEKADLAIQNPTAPTIATPGSSIEISYQITNIGTNNTSFNYTSLYLSKDESISSDDKLLGFNWIGSLDAGSSINKSQTLSLDTNLDTGNYYLLYKADALDNIFGLEDSNNVATRQITITSANSQGYNSNSGYGLVNAAAAVSKAVGQNTFADVPDLGGNDWGSDMVKAPESWAKGYTGKGVVVAVLDTGVDRNHTDLKQNIWTNSKEIAGNGIDDDGNGYVDDSYGWNFDSNNNNTLDVDGHGTHVSGTIAGANNGTGVTGVAHGAKIMPVKVLDDNGSGSYSAIAKGIYYAVDNGANVINLSLGSSYPNSELEKAIQYASSKNVVVVMAAGNSGGSAPVYPARYAKNYGIAVGAVDQGGNLASFSNRAGSNQLEYVTAPGVNVYSTLPGNKYGSYSGTSMATPHVAGVVALMLSANPNLTEAQVRDILASTSGNSTQGKSTTGWDIGVIGKTWQM